MKKVQQIKKSNDTQFVGYTLAIIFITTLVIYFKAIPFDFILNWDDNKYILENNDIRDLQWANIKLIFTNFYTNNYQPVTMLFYAIEHKIGGDDGTIYHINSILLHLINAFLVYVFIKKISPKNPIVALITSAFFAVHPMHVESVAWISERKDVLYTFFFLLSLIQYVNYLDSKKIKPLLFSFLFFVLSCLSKSAAVILPLVLLLLDFYCGRKYSWRTVLEKLPFFAISLIIGIVATHSQKTALQNMAPIMTYSEHILVVSHSFSTYILKAFVPADLSAIYPYPMEIGSALPAKYYVSLLEIGLLIAFVIYSLRWGKEVLFGSLFFVITIVLVLQFVPVGGATMADRYTYVPYIGLFFILGKLFEYVADRAENYKKQLSVIFILGFITFSSLSYARVRVWENDDLLFSDVLKKYPDSWMAHYNRGTYYYFTCATKKYANNTILKERYTRSAIADFEATLLLNISDRYKARTYLFLGQIRSDIGDHNGAVDAYSKTIITYPLFAPSAYIKRGLCNKILSANRAYANNVIKKNEYLKMAISDFEKSLRAPLADDKKAEVYQYIGISKTELGDYAGAIISLDHAIRINPKNLKSYTCRSDAKLMLEDIPGAINDCDKAIALDPKYGLAYINRGAIKYYIKDHQGAIKDAEEAIKINANNATAYTLRGNSHYALKNYDAALIDYNRAIELNPRDGVALMNRDKVLLELKK